MQLTVLSYFKLPIRGLQFELFRVQSIRLKIMVFLLNADSR